MITLKQFHRTKGRSILFWGAIGYIIALFSLPFISSAVSLLIPVLTILIAARANLLRLSPKHIESQQQSTVQDIPECSTSTSDKAPLPIGSEIHTPEQHQISPYFKETLEYLNVLQSMVVAENQRNNLDDEITDKTLNIISKVQAILPYIDELNIAQTKHEVRSIVLKDMNSVINPFLKLNGQNKLNNRRKLLEGLKGIHDHLKQITATIEQQDLYELDRKLELIAVKYRSNEIY